MTGTVYQRCRVGCGLICDHADFQRHEARCTGEARLEDCLRLPYAPVITWHQTNTEETETANLLEDLENLENLVVCIVYAYGPKTCSAFLMFFPESV